MKDHNYYNCLIAEKIEGSFECQSQFMGRTQFWWEDDEANQYESIPPYHENTPEGVFVISDIFHSLIH